MTAVKKILLIEDSQDIGDLIRQGLGSYHIDQSYSIAEAQASLSNEQYDLLLIDVSLPDGDGFDLCLNLQNDPAHTKTPKMILTGKDQVAEKIHGYNCGADDYVTKPFHILELKARVERHLARSVALNDNMPKHPNLDLNFEFQTCRILKDGNSEDAHLTQTEFRLLVALMKNKGHVLNREQLEQSVWQNYGTTIEKRGIDTHIAHLRRKLGDFRELIVSVYGQGYTFKP